MEKMVAQYGVTVVTQRHLHLRRLLAGTLAGAMEEVDQEILGAGVTSPGENGESSTVKKPQEVGILLVLLPRINRLVLGAELLAQLVPVKGAVTAWRDILGTETAHPEIIQLLFCLLRIWILGCYVTLAGDKRLFANTPPGTWKILNARMMQALIHGALAQPLQVTPRGPPTLTWVPLKELTLGAKMMCLLLRELQVGVEA